MHIPRSILLILLVACGSETQSSIDSSGETRIVAERQEPVFEIDMWPGEGIPVIKAIRPSLSLFQFPRVEAAVVATLTVEPGQLLQYDSTRYQTLISAPLRVREPATIKGRDLGSVQHLSKDQYYSGAFKDSMFAVAPGSVVELLQHRAEGACFVRIGSFVVDAETCPAFDTARFETKGEPRTLWWIHVRTKSGSGWLQLSDSTAKTVQRQF